jgi:hypothetical protein
MAGKLSGDNRAICGDKRCGEIGGKTGVLLPCNSDRRRS